MTVKVLFLCSRNKWRSPTAEQVFSEWTGLECLSAGLNPDSETPLTSELLEWADIVFVMERKHKEKLSNRFRAYLANKKVVCLNIPDKYAYMDKMLVKLLQAKVPRFLP